MRRALVFYGSALICGALVAVVLITDGTKVWNHFQSHNNTQVTDMFQAQEMFAGGETLNFCADGFPSAKGISFHFTNIKTGHPVGRILKSSRTATRYCVQYASPDQPQRIFVRAIGSKNSLAYALPIDPQPPRP